MPVRASGFKYFSVLAGKMDIPAPAHYKTIEVVTMRKLLLLQLLLFLMIAKVAAAENSNVIITQVLYDPLNSESGGEAVELYNPTAAAIDVSGWAISTETSLADATIPAGTAIGSGEYYMVADAGWSASRDDLSWPLADYEETITLTNADAGVALSNGTHFIDAVGWGNALNIGSGLYEGTPHEGAGNGEALARIKNGSSYSDSNNNINDFTASAPNFHNSSASQSSGKIKVIAVVQGSFPKISSFAIMTDDDATSTGIQINPVPKQNKTVELQAIVSHDNGNGYIQSVAVTAGGRTHNMTPSAINATSSLYAAKFNMSYYEAAGNYTANLTATDKSGFSANAFKVFEYSSMIAMEIDTGSLTFAAMPGTSSEITGDLDESTTANTTIQNTGNSALDVELSGTNLSSGSSIIGVSSIQYTFNGNYNNSLAGTLSYEKQVKSVGITAASKKPLSFRLNVPVATTPGNYTGEITLIAVKS